MPVILSKWRRKWDQAHYLREWQRHSPSQGDPHHAPRLRSPDSHRERPTEPSRGGDASTEPATPRAPARHPLPTVRPSPSHGDRHRPRTRGGRKRRRQPVRPGRSRRPRENGRRTPNRRRHRRNPRTSALVTAGAVVTLVGALLVADAYRTSYQILGHVQEAAAAVA